MRNFYLYKNLNTDYKNIPSVTYWILFYLFLITKLYICNYFNVIELNLATFPDRPKTKRIITLFQNI